MAGSTYYRPFSFRKQLPGRQEEASQSSEPISKLIVRAARVNAGRMVNWLDFWKGDGTFHSARWRQKGGAPFLCIRARQSASRSVHCAHFALPFPAILILRISSTRFASLVAIQRHPSASVAINWTRWPSNKERNPSASSELKAKIMAAFLKKEISVTSSTADGATMTCDLFIPLKRPTEIQLRSRLRALLIMKTESLN